MDNIFNEILQNIPIMYILMCNVATYVIITTLPWDFKRTGKRVIATISALLLFCIMAPSEEEASWMPMVYGFFLQYLSWDYCFKYVINWIKEKFKVNPDADLSIDEVETKEVVKKKKTKKS